MSKSLHEEMMRLRHYSGLSEERKPKGDWALVKKGGMGDKDRVLSAHKTKDAAEAAMRKKGGEPDSQFTNGMMVVDVSATGSYEMIPAMGGGYTVRPNMENWKKKQAAQAKAEAAPAAPMGTMDDTKKKMLSSAMADVIGYRQDVDRADREISIDNLEALVAMLKGHISPARHASLKAAVEGIGLGRLIDVLDDVRIELKTMLEPPKGMKKPAAKKK